MQVDKSVFTKQRLPTEDTKLFLFSKGLEDQTGGIDNTEFGIENIQEEFLQNRSTPFEKMGRVFDERIDHWIKIGERRQEDDILLIGFDLSK